MEVLLHEDLAALSDLDEQSLLESLSQRFRQDRIYVSNVKRSDLCACDCCEKYTKYPRNGGTNCI